jgi:putative SOS response-associated peptidase YedK
MCGRYASTKSSRTLAAEFDAVDATGVDAPPPDYNVAPTKPVFSIVQRHPRDAHGERDLSRTERSIRVMRWGLVPKWAKDVRIGNRMINTKSETAQTKPAFRAAIKYHRCLLPADGWYEWQRDGTTKQPYFMTTTDGSSLGLAAIWATWRDPKADEAAPPLVTCSVLTTSAVGPLADVHERMPLVLPTASWDRWLDPDLDDVGDLLAGPGREVADQLDLRPVSTKVNNVANNGADLLERVASDGRGLPSEAVGLDVPRGDRPRRGSREQRQHAEPE